MIWNVGQSPDYQFSLKSQNIAAYNPISAALLGKDCDSFELFAGNSRFVHGKVIDSKIPPTLNSLGVYSNV